MTVNMADMNNKNLRIGIT